MSDTGACAMASMPSAPSSLFDDDCLASRIRLIVEKIAEEVAEQESAEESSQDGAGEGAGGVLGTTVDCLTAVGADCLDGLTGYKDWTESLIEGLRRGLDECE